MAAALVGVIALLVVLLIAQAWQHGQERREWAQDRRELCERAYGLAPAPARATDPERPGRTWTDAAEAALEREQESALRQALESRSRAR